MKTAGDPEGSAASGREPTPRHRSELRELLKKKSPEPAELRRIAELVEWLYSLELARAWWEWAARAGDRDAIDYVEELKREMGA